MCQNLGKSIVYATKFSEGCLSQKENFSPCFLPQGRDDFFVKNSFCIEQSSKTMHNKNILYIQGVIVDIEYRFIEILTKYLNAIKRF